MRNTVFILIIWMAALHTKAQIVDLQADRPDQTETPINVPLKHFQMETGFVYESSKTERIFVHPSVLLKYGTFENVEIRVIVESQTVQQIASNAETSQSGVIPMEIGVKVKLFDEKKGRPAAALLGHIGIPWAGTKEFRTTYFPFNFRFSLQHTLTDWMSLGYNAGVEWDGESAEPTFVYTLVTGFSLTEKVGVFVEGYGFIPQKSKSDHALDAGLTWLIKPNLMLDVSGGWNFTLRSYFTGIGFSFRVPD
jgi:hypothetical protein